MCGRFTLTADSNTLQETLALGYVPALEPRFNIAPTQPVAVVADATSRDVALFRWGLIPFWAKDVSIGSRLINARAETLDEKPAFRAAFARRRCLVLADGFYEWRKGEHKGEPAQPFYFRLESGEPFAFAGLWETWRGGDDGEPLHSCTIVTGPANERVAAIHHRSPVILEGTALWQWMDPQAKPEQLKALLRPLPADELAAYPVATTVNSPAAQGAALIQAVAL